MSTRAPELLALILAAAALLFAGTAAALPTDRNQPIHLSADRADINDHTGVSVFTGHVVLSQGSMRLWSDTLTVYHDKQDRITRMVAEGNPVRFREQPKAKGEPITGSAQRVDYDVATRVVVLEQNAQLTQGHNRFQGPRIEYDRNGDVVKATSAGGKSGRVEITLQPKTAKERLKSGKGTPPSPAAPAPAPAKPAAPAAPGGSPKKPTAPAAAPAPTAPASPGAAAP